MFLSTVLYYCLLTTCTQFRTEQEHVTVLNELHNQFAVNTECNINSCYVSYSRQTSYAIYLTP